MSIRKKLLPFIISACLISLLGGSIECSAAKKKTKIPKFKQGLTGIQVRNNNFYLLDENSQLLRGWQNYAGNLYYFSQKNAKMFFGVKKIKNKYYYFDENGCCIPDVAFDKNRSLRHGFYESEEGKQYYFNGMLIKGFANIDGENYYFNEETGIMQDYETALQEYRNSIAASITDNNQNTSQGFVSYKNTVLHDGYEKDPQVDERTLLAAIIFCEAGNQKAEELYTVSGKKLFKGQLAVGYVIANRVTDKLGIKEVIYKKNQFTPARNGRLRAMLSSSDKIPDYIYNAADVVLQYLYSGANVVPEYPASEFKWSNFWGYKYAKGYTNFFSVFTNEDDYEIMQDHVFFNYSNKLKSNS